LAANRARGQIAVTVSDRCGRTVRTRVREQGSLRVRFPHSEADECEAVVINTAGGVAGGDRLDLAVVVGADARLVVVSAAAEKVYRSLDARAEIVVKLEVAAGGALRWLPQETILFDQARLNRRFDIHLAGKASLLLVEAVVFGRAAMGEAVRQGALVDRWRLHRDGRLIFAETLRLEGPIAEILALPAVADGRCAIGLLLVLPAGEEVAAALRAFPASGEVGVSAWNGFALARFCARDGASLRRDLLAALAVLKRGPPPRLWFN